jgi:hypothetical protein
MKALILILLPLTILIYSCGSKGGGGGPTNPCAGVTITVSGTANSASGAGLSDGSISVSASGGSGFTYSINGGAFQSSGNFTGLAAATYSVTAKDSRGCTGNNSFTVSVSSPCAGQTFTVGGTPISATPCLPTPNGSITVTTSGGGAGFTFNIGGGAFQASPLFSNLAANTYIVGAKEAGGCVKTASIVVAATTPGTQFAAVKVIINANCALGGCHVSPNPQGGFDFSQDCQIVINAARIKVRAVDNFGTGQQMPPPPTPGLSLNDRNAITAWVNGGGTYSN